MTISEVANEGIVDIDVTMVESQDLVVEIDGCSSYPDKQEMEVIFDNCSIEYSGDNQEIEYVFDNQNIEIIFEDETIEVVLDTDKCLI